MSRFLPESEALALLNAARRAAANAVVSWSDFAVGAALRCADGSVFTGCNIESPSLMQVTCAERVALLKALSEGGRDFSHLAVAVEKRPAEMPCGICRQMLMEFAPELVIVTAGADGKLRQTPLAELLPAAFIKP